MPGLHLSDPVSSTDTDLLQVEDAHLWLLAAGALLLMLAAAFVYLLVRHRRDRLHDLFVRLDAYLSGRLPYTWSFTKRRFARGTWYGLTLTLALALFLGMIYLFATITESWMDQEGLYELDRAVHQLLGGALTPPLVAALRLITRAGDLLTAAVVSAVLALYLLYRKETWHLLALFFTMVLGEALLWTLKLLFARGRPEEGLIGFAGHSFPSGHAFTAMVLYGFLVFLLWRRPLSTPLRILASAALLLLILLVGLSRVLLGVHWVSDVIGGFAIGLAWLVCSLLLTRVLQAYKAPSTVL